MVFYRGCCALLEYCRNASIPEVKDASVRSDRKIRCYGARTRPNPPQHFILTPKSAPLRASSQRPLPTCRAQHASSNAFRLGFARAKAPEQLLGSDDWRGCGVTWACRVVLRMRNGAALLCVIRLRMYQVRLSQCFILGRASVRATESPAYSASMGILNAPESSPEARCAHRRCVQHSPCLND